MERSFNAQRTAMRELGRIVADMCKDHGACQDVSSVRVNFAPNGSIRASVTMRASVYIAYNAEEQE